MSENKLSPEAEALLSALKKASVQELAEMDKGSFLRGKNDGNLSSAELSKAVDSELVPFSPKKGSEIAARYPQVGQMGDLINEIGRAHPAYVDRDVSGEYDRNAKLNLKAINPEYGEFIDQVQGVKEGQTTDKSSAALETNPVALAQTEAQNPNARGA